MCSLATFYPIIEWNYASDGISHWRTLDQLELSNHNPLFKPKSGTIQYLTRPEVTHARWDAVDLPKDSGTALAFFFLFFPNPGSVGFMLDFYVIESTAMATSHSWTSMNKATRSDYL